jgi:toxin FitB
MIVLDTNIVSEPIKPMPSAALIAWWRAQNRDSLYLTTVSVAELRSGVEVLPLGRRRDLLTTAIDETLREFKGRILSFDEPAAAMFAQVVARAKACGNQIGFADAAIAAITMTKDFH